MQKCFMSKFIFTGEATLFSLHDFHRFCNCTFALCAFKEHNIESLKALCNEFFDGEIFALRYSVLCTGSKDANRFPKLQVALFL